MLSEITSAELYVALSELSYGIASGCDEIHCMKVRQLGSVPSWRLLRPFSCSLRPFRLPAKWNHSIIVSVLKPQRPTSEMSSFRPITLTITLCNLNTRILVRHVVECIEEKMQTQQVGLGQISSALVILMQVTSAVRRKRNGGEAVASFIDYARAFD
ncbi:hypothetical protein TRVL_08460 [Trypanosoma vivax]|nr:hypothetical protein TRVL_08460 [Trypanosoma vivax]